MPNPDEFIPSADRHRRAGHYEILGETLAKFEFFESGWNPFNQKNLFIAYVASRDAGYQGDIFIFPVRDFVEKIRCAPTSGSQRRRVVISRLKDDSERWFLRRTNRRFTKVTEEVGVDVSQYRRNFALLEKVG